MREVKEISDDQISSLILTSTSQSNLSIKISLNIFIFEKNYGF